VAACNVQKRRWAVVGAGFLLIIVVLVLWAGGKSRIGLTLMFIGYTNQLLTPTFEMGATLTPNVWLDSTGDTLGVEPERFTVPTALVLATNTGSVPVAVYSLVSPDNFSASDFAAPSPTGLPRVLKPGQSTFIKVVVDPRQPWWTEISYQRRGLRERLYGLVWRSGNATVRAWVGPKLPGLTPVKFGPVTNQPPSGYTTFPVRLEKFSPTLRPNRPLEDLMF
jgi:hypothetical protein